MHTRAHTCTHTHTHMHARRRTHARMHICTHTYTHTHTIGVGLPPSQDRIDAISGELRDIKKSPSSCSLKAIATQLREIKETNELAQHTPSHSLDLQEMHSLELQEMKASLLSLESTVKKLSDKSNVGIPK